MMIAVHDAMIIAGGNRIRRKIPMLTSNVLLKTLLKHRVMVLLGRAIL
jgi:hypothetical protein